MDEATAQMIRIQMKEFLEDMTDHSEDEWYGTDYKFHKETLEQFMEYLLEKMPCNDIKNAECVLAAQQDKLDTLVNERADKFSL